MLKYSDLFVAVLIILSSLVFENSAKQCFPKGFQFGVATASYQIEGAWNVSGKGESIWDRYTHEHPERVFDHSNGDVAADSYHFFKEDVRMLKALEVNFYRFSISWPRILPSGYSYYVNPDGIRYYTALLDELEKNGIKPLVTMYHWDLPQELQEIGGWTNPIIADLFEDYARVLFELFGDRVKTWLTVNEPLSFCVDGYGGLDAPGEGSSGIQTYLCAHNVLRAHARAYHLYDNDFRKQQGGKIGITVDSEWYEPASQSKGDRQAAETAIQFALGWYLHPILSKGGDYPAVMRKRIDEMSKRQKFPHSRLPTFTQEEVKNIRGSYDFLGFNHYTTSLATPKGDQPPNMKPSYYEDVGVKVYQDPDWPKTNTTGIKIVPWGFKKVLNWIKEEYNNPVVLITENGVSSPPGLQDDQRLAYLDGYLRSLQEAIEEGCNVIGYTCWSLMDNFEWMRGFSERFGLYEVDYSSPNRTRTARLSAHFFREVVTTGCIPDSWPAQLNLVQNN